VALASAFVAAAAVRGYSFVDDVTPETEGDDWYYYKRGALSILHEGWTMPAIDEAYYRPAGFLYNYFVAAVFALLGENAAYVYLIHAALLGGSIVLMYLTFRARLAPGGGLLYLVLSIVFLAIDAFWKYTGRLLSENLLLFWIPLGHLAMLRVLDGGRARDGLAAGLLFGLAVATRPNTLLVAVGMSALAGLLGPGPATRRLGASVALALGAAVIVALIPLRDYAVTGQLGLRVLTDTQDWEPRPATMRDRGAGLSAAWSLAEHFARRALYCLGLLFVGGAKYPLMPHWVLMWGGVAAFATARLRERRLAPWEVMTVGFVVLYLGPLLAAGSLTSYGVRMIVPVVPTVLLLAVQGTAERLSRPEAG